MSAKEARQAALEALYAADLTGAEPDLGELSARAGRLVTGVRLHRDDLDEVIASLAEGWRLERMPAVDRNILRLGAYELLHTDTPTGVVVDEAVELAKSFSTSRSGAFVNGVLGRLAENRNAARRARCGSVRETFKPVP